MEIKQTQKFHKWFSKLDNVTSAIVFARLLVVSMGSLGLWRSVGKGVSELKIDHGPGYRVYFTFRGGELILQVRRTILIKNLNNICENF